MKKLYINGKVYTGEMPLQEAFATENGKFVFAGKNEEVLQLKNTGDEVIDLNNCFVCSGFNDSHMHMGLYGRALMAADLSKHTGSIEDMLQCLRDFISEKNIPKGQWTYGRGWNQDYFSDVKRMPNRYDLDRVSTEIPIYVCRACEHCVVLNSKAIELLGITADTPCPEGGKIGIMNGEPDGLLFDNAMGLVFDHVPAPEKAEMKEMIKAACKALNSYGVTSCQTDDYGTSSRVTWQEINEIYKELEASGELTVRVYEQSIFDNLTDLEEFVESGCITGKGTDMFKIGPLKILGDGALGAHTAYLSEPYHDDPSTCGLPIFSQEVMDDMVSYANKHNMQVAIHAIGDACLDMVLDSYEKALQEHPRNNHRHGIVHCQISRPDQLERIARLNMHVYCQSIFLDYDSHIVESRVGKKLAKSSYNWKTLMNLGATVSNGTDCPVEMPDALAGIQCAVTRTSLHNPDGPYLAEQAFSVQEAIDSYTKNSAFANFEEKVKGQIKQGMFADFVVLKENPFEVPADRIKNIEILATYLAGNKVYPEIRNDGRFQ